MSEDDIVPPPSNYTVPGERRVLLYDYRGVPIVRVIGFHPGRDTMQTRGTYPETHIPKPKGKPKGGKCGK